MEGKLDATSSETVALPASQRAQISGSSVPHFTTPSIAEEGRFVPGTLLAGRYRIIGLLGIGGMGEVYRATDLMLGQSVALKFLPEAAAENESLLERFHGEVRVARQVSHPNVCRVYDIGEAEGLPFISMEYVDGEDLATLLRRIGRLPADRAIQTAREICAGLAAAHSKGVIHRDLKPQNIMMNRQGDIMIMDFGLAAIANQLSGAEARNGTPGYMSPEQLKGTEVTAKSDIYSLGLVLYELFTGKRPFAGETIRELIEQQESARLTSMSSIAADIDPAVENIIRRCLEPDSSRRPANALAVSAALPGGDPVAAALAAGETPSPELVAASGKTEGLALRYSLACLAMVVLCVFAAPLLKEQRIAFYRTALEFPPDVLRQKARDIAATLGYSKKPNDSVLWLDQRLQLLTYLDLLPPPRNWNEWLASEAPFSAVYREGPDPLIALPTGDVNSLNPAPVRPGMLEVELDGQGRLRGFSAVPYASAQESADQTSPEGVFRAAQLDLSKFTEVTPVTVPGTVADHMRAWKGPHPAIPNTQLTIETGSWKGQITYAKFIWPWMSEAGGKERPPSVISTVRRVLLPFLMGGGFIFAVLLAHRNWKQGRGDHHGAFVLAGVQFGLQLLVWAGSVHAVPRDAMLDLFFNDVGHALFSAAVLLLLYLALEPALRARWPHSIVTWNRVLRGRWRDAQVGSHLLIGAAIGTVMWTASELYDTLAGSKNGVTMDTVGGLFLLTGTRQWIAGMLSRASEGLSTGLFVFFVIFALRALLRRDWIAAIVGAFLFAALQADLANDLNWGAEFALYVVLFAALIFVLLRFGLVASISAVFFLNALNGMTLGTDWKAWYVPTGLATMTLMLVITFFAFKQSLGGRSLLGGEIERR